jgi:predicted AlkP superfamily phosphohydrolase/phosphomutase
VNWEKTRVYSGENIGTLRVNLKGRDPMGQLRDEEYETLLADVIGKLEALKDPKTNSPVVERVYRREELYWGEYVGGSPELLIWPTENKYRRQKKIFRNRERAQVVMEKKRMGVETSGTHRLEGILLAKGPGIRNNAFVSESNIYDLFPTVLYAMGLDVPSDLDGRVIEALFEAGYMQNHPTSTKGWTLKREKSPKEAGETYDEEEAEQIEERLRGLGYLE